MTLNLTRKYTDITFNPLMGNFIWSGVMNWPQHSSLLVSLCFKFKFCSIVTQSFLYVTSSLDLCLFIAFEFAC